MKYLLALSVLFLSPLSNADEFQDQAQVMLRRVAASTAKVIIPREGFGSGFIVQGPSGKKYMVTNDHACETVGKHLLLKFEDMVRPGTAIVTSRETDLCLISLSEQGRPALPIGTALGEGQLAFDVSHPGGGPLTSSYGFIIGFGPVSVGYDPNTCPGNKPCTRRHQAIFFSSRTIPGSSGSPLLNTQGEVIGVVFAGNEEGGAAIPSAALIELLKGR